MQINDFELNKRIVDYYVGNKEIISDLIELKFIENINLDNVSKSLRYTKDFCKMSLFIDKLCSEEFTPYTKQCFTEAMFSSYCYFVDEFKDLTVEIYILFMESCLNAIKINPILDKKKILCIYDESLQEMHISVVMNIEIDEELNFKSEQIANTTGIILVNFTKEITKILMLYDFVGFIQDCLTYNIF